MEYAETMALIEKGMPPPRYWTREDWRNAAMIANRLERLAIEDRPKEF